MSDESETQAALERDARAGIPHRSERRRRTAVVKARTRQEWRKLSWPWATRGARKDQKEFSKIREGAERARVRDELKTADPENPDLDSPTPYRVRGVDWDMW